MWLLYYVNMQASLLSFSKTCLLSFFKARLLSFFLLSLQVSMLLGYISFPIKGNFMESFYCIKNTPQPNTNTHQQKNKSMTSVTLLPHLSYLF
ncbi:hypothetical protein Lalb_Chr16g0391821 [Lupinus albus]|uniref:Uncharacterized protein n=1 Tax=Lupinus albus TaxID=3870 RepID=A0A6A4NZF4_LUPAL|nr:hypothetical protein Lalb_Chr16g0391821 [Lupinus albus]